MATLEQYAANLEPGGFDTPEKQQYLQQTVMTLRQAHPGQTDDQIIAAYEESQKHKELSQLPIQNVQGSPVAPVEADAPEPVAAPVAGNVTAPAAAAPQSRGDMYRSQTAINNQKYGPEAEQKVRDEARKGNVLNEAARSANLGLRAIVQAGGGSTQALDQDFKEQTAKANRPYDDFQAMKASAQQQLEAALRAGDIDAADARNQLSQMGLEAALKEKKDAETFRIANSDPGSATSTAKRAMFKAMSPDLYAKIPNIESMSGKQIDGYLPAVAKEYEKRIEADGAARAAEIKAKGSVDAAKIKADAKGAGGPKISDIQRGISGEEKIDNNKKKDEQELQGVNKSLASVDQLEGLIKGGLATGAMGAAAQALPGWAQSKERQQANQIIQGMILELQSAQKGSQTEGDAKRIGKAIDALGQDDPSVGIKLYRDYMSDRKTSLEGNIASSTERQTRMRQTTDPSYQPAGKSGSSAVTTKAAYDALPSGSTFVDGNGKTWKKP